MKLVGYQTSESGMSAIRSREAGKLVYADRLAAYA